MVAMSGGVDSSVAAALCLDAGHEVVGVTMRLWGGESDTGCCAVSDVDDARRVAHQLGIDHHVFNFGDEFGRHVIDPYVAAHAAGSTPNPCIECNRHLKFDKLVRRAHALGFDTIATGHHARRVDRDDGTVRIRRGVDRAKDQSYVLYPLRAEVLAGVLLPIGELTKAEVRRIAIERGLRTADKPDSQDVCFVTRSEGRVRFLGDRIPLRPARVVDLDGSEVGRVDAVELVTIGQRRGLELAGGPARRFVVDVDTAAAVVTVGSDRDLDRDEVIVSDLVWTANARRGRFDVQVSAHGEARPALVEPLDEHTTAIRWDLSCRRVAPGQSVVIYEGDEVVGGGIAR